MIGHRVPSSRGGLWSEGPHLARRRRRRRRPSRRHFGGVRVRAFDGRTTTEMESCVPPPPRPGCDCGACGVRARVMVVMICVEND